MNYLLEVETKYGQIRGCRSQLRPLDWQLADEWEQKGYPLWLVLRAMDEVEKKFNQTKRADKINSLSYFKQEVEKQFAEWQRSQVGKAPEENDAFSNEDLRDFRTVSFNVYDEKESDMEKYSIYTNENLLIVEDLINQFRKSGLPEPLAAAASQTRQELIQLADNIRQNGLQMDDIEDRLRALKLPLESSFNEAVDDDEKAAMLETIKREYAKIRLTDETRQKVLIKQIREKFGLPDLTLFAI